MRKRNSPVNEDLPRTPESVTFELKNVNPNDPPIRCCTSFLKFIVKSYLLLSAVNVLTMPFWIAYLAFYIIIDPCVRTDGLYFLVGLIFATSLTQMFGFWAVWNTRWHYMWLHVLLCSVIFCCYGYLVMIPAKSLREFIPLKVPLNKEYPELIYHTVSMAISLNFSILLASEMHRPTSSLEDVKYGYRIINMIKGSFQKKEATASLIDDK